MKKIIIIGTYPDTQDKLNLLDKCLDKLSKTDYDLMLVSHYPIPEFIQNKVDFYIYDKRNELEPLDLTPVFWIHTHQFEVYIHGNGHMLACSNNMFNGISLSSSLGYNYFYFIESDSLINENDLEKIDELRVKMFEENKKMVFFKHGHELDPIYESLTFGGIPSYFINVLGLPRNFEHFRTIESPTLEKVFITNYRHRENDFYLIPSSSKEYYSKSEINRVAHYVHCEIIKDITNNKFILFISNFESSPYIINIDIIDGPKFEMNPGGWYFTTVFMEDSKLLTVKISENGMLIEKTFDLSENKMSYYENKGTIKFAQ